MTTLFVNAEHLAAVRIAVKAQYPAVRVVRSSGERFGYRLVSRGWMPFETDMAIAALARETIERARA